MVGDKQNGQLPIMLTMFGASMKVAEGQPLPLFKNDKEFISP
jgi:hypothetical protein